MEEFGQSYELKIVDFSKAEQKTPEHKALNPKGKVAALVRDDGSVLTEYAAIAMWLAMTNPEKKLLPTNPEGLARTIEAMNFIVGTVNMLSCVYSVVLVYTQTALKSTKNCASAG